MRFIALFCFFLLCGSAFAQEDPKIMLCRQRISSRGEVILKISSEDFLRLDPNSISIDRIDDTSILFYTNERGFNALLKTGIDFQFIEPASLKSTVKMCDHRKQLADWQSYPTYNLYVEQMYAFEQTYPGLCKIYDVGKSVKGRQILFAKISDNVNEKEIEPEFMYSSSMHGDELTGYVILLRYIDYLLSNYGEDTRVTSIVNSTEIWINPLGNPDGTYVYSDSTIFGAKRFNANNIDLNRNFPDPKSGEHPDNNDWQLETVAVKALMEIHNFVLSANIHDGSQVVNYPWDTWEKRHPDDSWFQYISRQYADTAHAVDPTYMTALENGITNGWDWYMIDGGKQDFVTYFLHGREVTLELSYIKIPDPSDLEYYWERNYRSLTSYIEQVHFGIRGLITDSLTDLPLKAMIEVIDHDTDQSYVFSDSIHGSYYRPIIAGEYKLRFSAPGYLPMVIDQVSVVNREATVIDVKLISSDFSHKLFDISISPNPSGDLLEIYFDLFVQANVKITLNNLEGGLVDVLEDNFYSGGKNKFIINNLSRYLSGVYVLIFQANNATYVEKVVIL